MCGIYGLIRASGGIDPTACRERRDRLRHRGPDACGEWLSPEATVYLGHRRLSIIDLSDAARQPMASIEGRHLVTFNGEIYNFVALRQELEAAGHAFRTRSDTEVILAAYAQWGEDCVQRLDGMFAFALLDRGTSSGPARMLLARDRAGEKPLYYRAFGDGIEFASELKAIAHGARWDADAANAYLALGYVPADQCLVAGVHKLPPAHLASFDLATNRLTLRRYWQLPARTAGDASGDFVDTAGRLLRESVRARLVSDVPLGVLLSGGMDSSLVVAAAAEASSRPVKTFTVTVPGSPLDESRHARIVASHFGTDHHELPLDRAGLETLDELEPFVDEPIADSSIIPMFQVSALTRRHVTVVLGGDGGDELFGGYPDYARVLRDQQRLAHVPTPLLTLLARAASLLPAGVRGRNRIGSLRGGALEQMVWGGPFFDATSRARLTGQDWLAALRRPIDAPERWLHTLFATGTSPLDAMTRMHFLGTLPDDFLVKVDRATMVHGLEARAPFLDHRLAEYCFGCIPDDWKVSRGRTRIVERALADRWLPKALDLDRKQGFSIPMDDWLRREGRERLRHRLTGLPSWISRSTVDRLVDGLMAGRANGARLFSLIMLAIAGRNLRLED